MTNAGQAVQRRSAAREWRGLGRLVLESFATGAVVSIVLLLAVLLVASKAQAASPHEQGTLALRDAQGATADASLMFTDVHMSISGMTARVAVTQRFVNPTPQWREGVYTFPLPDRAAVDHLHMQIGARAIEGVVKAREDARRTYEQARTEGRKATLVEQERPNLFTTNVAHIGPSEEIVVAIEYQEKLAYDNGNFSLRFPLAITPRYIPGTPLAPDAAAAAAPGGGWAVPTDAVADADRITPPVVHPSQGPINPVAIAIDLNAGFPLARIASTYHTVHIEEQPGNRYRITLAEGVVPASRDFELTWRPDVGHEPGAALFNETRDGRAYALLMVLPPTMADPATQRRPREITYIVDTSGSMEGVSIAQAREALLVALDRLAPGDRFNVIEFNSTTRALFSAPMPVDVATLDTARSFVRDLRARGGTEMRPALEAALAAPRSDVALRQIVFLTDGAVGNEAELLRLIERGLDDRRLFTIGIGPAPNTYFLKKAAEAGRGTFTFIGDVREVKDKMSALIRKIESPVLTDMRIDWPASVESYPRTLPDLYAGEPVVMTAELRGASVEGNVALAGRRGDKAWGTLLPFATGGAEPGISQLWARDRIETLMDAKRNGAPEDQIRAAVTQTALAHHLVSRYTSLVAVDVTPSAPAGVESTRTALPGNLPDGLSYDAIFVGLPQTGTPAEMEMVLGLLALLAAALVWRIGVGTTPRPDPREASHASTTPEVA
ncbi:MAG TPA: marine proteobacterial sortase target protein [Casimicrobiaceae bacterium]|nr:marine proteobacterial sortase target protein [Casimicrobiaceae bacterium]